MFELAPPAPGQTGWTEQLLYPFSSAGNYLDGARPFGLVSIPGSLALFGGTLSGGTGPSGAGTLFRLDPPAGGPAPWTLSEPFDFTGSETQRGPTASPINLTVGRHRLLFGVAAYGGSERLGAVFSQTQH